MMKKIGIYTQAHNAEKTLKRTIESVLSQRYENFLYYVADNCSTDGTRDIIIEYAKKDSRIVPIFYDGDGESAEKILEHLLQSYKKIVENMELAYFCNIDADDTYHVDFLQTVVQEAENHCLDIVAAGYDYVDSVSGTTIGRRALTENVILEGANFGIYLPQYHCFMRTVWAKLYKIGLFRKLVENGLADVCFGLDTIMVFEMLRNAKKIGIVGGVYLDYYVSQKSASYVWIKNREKADAIINEHVYAFLLTKVGYVSAENKAFLDHVYINGMNDTLHVLQNSSLSESEKFVILRDIFSSSATQNAINDENLNVEIRNNFLRSIYSALTQISEGNNNPDEVWIGLNIAALGNNQEMYVDYSIKNIKCLLKQGKLDEAKKEIDEWHELLPNSEEITLLYKDFPL